MTDTRIGQTTLQIVSTAIPESDTDLADGSWDQNSGHSPWPQRSPLWRTLQHSQPARPFHERLQSLNYLGILN